MQEKILQYVRNTIQDQIKQNYGPEEEITIGYEDDYKALQAELNALEAVQNSIRERTYEVLTPKVATSRMRLFSRSPVKGRGDSGFGGDLGESQDH